MASKKGGKETGGVSPTSPEPFPKLSDLHQSHYGLTKEVAHQYAQAADVCFTRHHAPPLDLAIKSGGNCAHRRHKWRKPSDRVNAAWANADDAKRDGAYAVCIAAIELTEGLFAVGRCETRTGADYYLGKTKNAKYLEQAYRLEVSGTDGDETYATSVLKQKKQQTKDGTSDLPAFAAVVSYKSGVVLCANAEE